MKSEERLSAEVRAELEAGGPRSSRRLISRTACWQRDPKAPFARSVPCLAPWVGTFGRRRSRCSVGRALAWRSCHLGPARHLHARAGGAWKARDRGRRTGRRPQLSIDSRGSRGRLPTHRQCLLSSRAWRLFVVMTPAGEIHVLGTCFRVEVKPMNLKQTALGARSVVAVGAVASATVVSVYEGRVQPRTRMDRRAHTRPTDGNDRRFSLLERGGCALAHGDSRRSARARRSPPPTDRGARSSCQGVTRSSSCEQEARQGRTADNLMEGKFFDFTPTSLKEPRSKMRDPVRHAGVWD